MVTLEDKIEIAKTVIHGLTKRVKNKAITLAWSGGKDSTVLLHIVKQMYGRKIPFSVSFADSRFEMKETTEFIESLPKLWNFELKRQFLLTQKEMTIVEDMESKQIIKLLKNKYSSFLAAQNNNMAGGILWGNRFQDRNTTKSFFKKSGKMWFAYPIFHFTEMDIWTYIYKYKVPINKLYEKGYRNTNINPFLKNTKTIPRVWFRFIQAYLKVKLVLRLV